MAITHGLPLPFQSQCSITLPATPHATTPPQTPTTACSGFPLPILRPAPPQQANLDLEVLGQYHNIVNNKWRQHYERESASLNQLHKQQVEKLNAEKIELANKNKDNASSISWHKAEHSRLKDQFVKDRIQLIAEHDDAEKASRTEVGRLKAQISIQDQQIQKLDALTSDYEAKLEALQNEKDDAETKCASEKEIVHDLRNMLFDSNSKLADSQEDNAALKADLATERSANVDLQAAMDATEVAKEAAITQRDNAAAALLEEQTALHKLRDEMRLIKETATQTKKLSRKVEDCKRDNSSLQQHNDGLTRKLSTAEQDLIKLRAEVDSVKSQHSTSETKITKLSADLTASEKNINEMLETIIENNSKLLAEQDQRKSLQADLDKAKADTDARGEELGILKQTLKDKEAMLEQLRKKEAEKSKTLDGVRAWLNDSKAEVLTKAEDIAVAAKQEDDDDGIVDAESIQPRQGLHKGHPSIVASVDGENGLGISASTLQEADESSSKVYSETTTESPPPSIPQPAASLGQRNEAKPKRPVPSPSKNNTDAPNPAANSPTTRPFLAFTKSKLNTAGPSKPSVFIPSKKLPNFKKKPSVSSTSANNSSTKCSPNTTTKRHTPENNEDDEIEVRPAKRPTVTGINKPRPQKSVKQPNYYHPGVWR